MSAKQRPSKKKSRTNTESLSGAMIGIVVAGLCLILLNIAFASGQTDGGFAVLIVMIMLAPIIGVAALIYLVTSTLQARKNIRKAPSKFTDSTVSGGSLFRLFGWFLSAIVLVFIVMCIIIPWLTYTLSHG